MDLQRKRGGSQRSGPVTEIEREKKNMRKRSRVRYRGEAETESLIMRPVKQTQLSEQQRETETVGLETHTLVPHLWMPIWGLLSGDTIVLHFRALILYACYCTRQTARDTAVLAAVEHMIRKEKGIWKQGLKTGLCLEIMFAII